MMSPLAIFGFDTIIGKINSALITALIQLFLIVTALLMLLAQIFDNTVMRYLLLAITIGMTQFVASIMLTLNQNLLFKICSQILPKLIIFTSICLSFYFSENAHLFTSITTSLLLFTTILLAGRRLLTNKLLLLCNWKTIQNLAQMSIHALSALFVSDLILRLPYILSLASASAISNEFDIATAFTSSWVLPLAIATRINEVQSGYHYQTYKKLIRPLKTGIMCQIAILIVSSIILIYLLTSLSFITETFTGVMTAMIFTGWPALLIVIFPNITRMFYLSERHRFSSSFGTITSLVFICAVLGVTSILKNQLILSSILLLIIYFMYLILQGEKEVPGNKS
jgi:hypothetical protein